MRKFLTLMIAALCVLSFGYSASFAGSAAVFAEEPEPPKTEFGKEVSDWKAPFGAGTIENGGYQPAQYDNLKEGIASDYIAVVVEIPKLDAGAWVAVQLTGNTDHYEWNQSGMHIKFTNSDGKIRLDIYGSKTLAENVIFNDLEVAEMPQIRLQLIYSAGAYGLRVNEKAFSNPELTTEHMRDADGKTYVNFAKFGAADALALRFMDITTVKPAGFTAEEWNNPHSFGSMDNYRYRNFANDGLTAGIASDYLEVDLSLDTLEGDAWVAVQLTGDPTANSWNQSGMHIVFKNNGSGGIVYNIYGSQTIAEGASLGQNVSAKPRVLIKLKFDGAKYSLQINKKLYHKDDGSAIKDITVANMRGANGKTYVNTNAFATTDQHLTAVYYINAVSDRLIGTISAADVTPPVVSVPKSHFKHGYKGEEVTLPLESVKANDAIDGDVSVSVKVFNPADEPVTVTDKKFTPDVKGQWSVIYSAADKAGNIGDATVKFFVVDAEADQNSASSYYAPWGGLNESDGVLSMAAHCAFLKPLSFKERYLKTTIDILGLSDEADQDLGVEAWVSVAFLQSPMYSDPSGPQAYGLYLMFYNNGGKLYTSVIMAGPLGSEMIAIKDPFTAASNAIGEVVIELVGEENKDGEEIVALYVNGNKCVNESMSKAFLSEIMDAKENMFLGFGAYDTDANDEKVTNAESRRISVKGFEFEREIDEEDPVVSAANVPQTGKVGVELALPEATVTDNSGETIRATVTVKDPEGKTVTVINGKFTPAKAGEYTVVYKAADSAGNEGVSPEYKIQVAPADKDEGGCKSAAGLVSGGAALAGALAVVLVVTVVGKRKKTEN